MTLITILHQRKDLQSTTVGVDLEDALRECTIIMYEHRSFLYFFIYLFLFFMGSARIKWTAMWESIIEKKTNISIYGKLNVFKINEMKKEKCVVLVLKF